MFCALWSHWTELRVHSYRTNAKANAKAKFSLILTLLASQIEFPWNSSGSGIAFAFAFAQCKPILAVCDGGFIGHKSDMAT